MADRNWLAGLPYERYRLSTQRQLLRSVPASGPSGHPDATSADRSLFGCLDRRRERAPIACLAGPAKDQPVPTVVRCRERRQDVAPRSRALSISTRNGTSGLGPLSTVERR
jgi:hypothetical protein